LTGKLFSKLALSPAFLENIAVLEYRQMTPIQAETLPIALKGEDVIGQAKTGSGKTVAFAIPLLHGLNADDNAIQGLVICPTRELCIQVTDEIRKLARYRSNIKVVALYGGQIMALQKSALKTGAHIVVGTPGRIKDHLARESISLGKIKTLVLDEADRMLEMGFLNDIKDIIGAIPKARQTLLFSATFPENIQDLSQRFQNSPVHVSVESESGQSEIVQKFLFCDSERKLPGLTSLLSHLQPESALVFCNTKSVTKDVFRFLQEQGHSVATLHGDLEQRDREQVLMRFRHQSCRILVATDVAARGLDIQDLTAVINFEVPHDTETYVHRIGRTGRAGKEGYALTLTGQSERHRMQVIEEALGHKFPCEAIESAIQAATETAKGRGKGALISGQVTLAISAGRRDKLRAGDILGALTRAGSNKEGQVGEAMNKEPGIAGKSVGKIDVMDYETYVSVERKSVKPAFNQLSENKIKGKKFRVRILG
jgi:ATP-dependent RNA helicase DbpA